MTDAKQPRPPGLPPLSAPDGLSASARSSAAGSLRARRGALGPGMERRSSALLERLSAAGEVARELVMEVVEPPMQTVPVHGEAPVPLAALEDGKAAGPGLARASLSLMDPEADEDGVRRRGTVFSGVTHTITAVIGAGVLTLPSAMATLGYAGGLITLLFAGAVTLYTAQLLADLYVVDGKRQRTYTGMVKTVLGGKGELLIGVVQLANLAITAVAYQVTAGKTMRAIAESACGGGGQCFKTYWVFVVLFGIVQLVLSQVPSLESLAWASVVGAGSSFGYSAIAFALSAANLPKQWLGTAWGRADSAWADLNAVGNILFAFSFSFMLLEIQDTLKGDGTPRGPVRPMKQAVNVAMACMSVFYVAIAVAGYAVWGNDASNAFGRLLPDDVLEGYPNPKWATVLANVLVLLHMVPAYQVWSQPLFECTEFAVEGAVHRRGKGWPTRGGEVAFRLAFRSAYVICTTFFAVLIPFMGVILGLAGALGFWPATVWAPVECYIKVFRPRPGVVRSLRVLSVICAVLTALCVVSGVQQLVVSSSSGFKLFSGGE